MVGFRSSAAMKSTLGADAANKVEVAQQMTEPSVWRINSFIGGFNFEVQERCKHLTSEERYSIEQMRKVRY